MTWGVSTKSKKTNVPEAVSEEKKGGRWDQSSKQKPKQDLAGHYKKFRFYSNWDGKPVEGFKKWVIWSDLAVCLMSLPECLTNISNLRRSKQNSSSFHHQSKTKLSYVFSIFFPILVNSTTNYPIIQARILQVILASSIFFISHIHSTQRKRKKEKTKQNPKLSICKKED